ncbi:hypothetical protein Tco_1083552, partial [Tanacetum coccineum]
MALVHLLQSYFWGLSEITSALPAHLVDVPPVGDSAQTVSEISGALMQGSAASTASSGVSFNPPQQKYSRLKVVVAVNKSPNRLKYGSPGLSK